MLSRIASVVVAILMVAGLANAQPLADKVPGDALIYFGWSGSDTMGPGYAGSHLEAVLKDSQMTEFVNQSIPKLLAKIGATDQQAAEAMGLLSAIGGPMWRHSTAFYFGGLEMGANGPEPKVAILCDAGAEGKGLADQLKKVLANVPAPIEIKVEEQGGLVMLSTGAKGWGPGQKPAAALADNATFKASLAQVQKDSVIAAYVNLDGIVTLADQMTANSPAEAHWAKIRDAVGLRGVKQIIGTAGFDGKDWMTQGFVAAPAPRNGLLAKMFDASPLSTDILKTIPQTATVAMAGKFDLGGLLAVIRNGAAQLDPQTGQAVEGALAQVHDMIGLDLQKDLFDLFGDEWALYMDPMTAGNGMLGFVVVNKARDPAKLEASLTKLEDMGNGILQQVMGREKMTIQFKRTPVNGVTLHHFAVPFVSPSWAIKDGNLYLGLYPQVVEAAMEQGGGKGKSILDNEDYLAVQKRLGNQAGSGMSFENLPKTAPDGYQSMLMMSRLYLGFADMFGADSPAMLLPPLRKIMPHLSPAGSVDWSDAAGWHSKGVSPFPGSDMLTPGGGGQMMVGQEALLISILLPSLNRARETANRVKCASNMRQVGLAIQLYANENKGKYPPDLGTLVLTQDITGQVFICPSGSNGDARLAGMKPEDAAKWVNEHSDYVYLGKGMDARTGAEIVVLYEKADAHGGQGMNMLFGDGHVEFQMMPSAMKMIEDQRAGKKGRGI
jgi:prepilin-type processing-associated H-X9-DG protein